VQKGTYNTCVKIDLKIPSGGQKCQKTAGGFFWLTLYTSSTGESCFKADAPNEDRDLSISFPKHMRPTSMSRKYTQSYKPEMNPLFILQIQC